MAKNYTPVSYNTHNPDTMYLVHDSVHKYVTILRHYPGREGSGLAIQLALPDMPPSVIINMQGPFEKAQPYAMDKWPGTFNRVDILMGDCTDKIWGELHKPTRWCHTKLTDGSLQDAAMAVAEDISPAGLVTHKACRVFTSGGGGSMEPPPPPKTGGFGKRAQLTGTINPSL